MSSLTRRMQRATKRKGSPHLGRGSKVGVSNPQDKQLQRRLIREARREERTQRQ